MFFLWQYSGRKNRYKKYSAKVCSMTVAIFTTAKRGTFVLFCFQNAPQMSPKIIKFFTSQMSPEIFMKHYHFERSNPLSLGPRLTCIRKCNLAFEYIWRILIRGSSISLWYLTHLIKTETPLKVNGLADFDNISAYFHELTWESQKP